MKKLLFLLVLSPALAQAQFQVQGGATFTLDLPVVIPQLVIVQPGIQVVPDVDYEVFHVDGFYWTRHDGGWYRSNNPRAGWVYMPRGVPPGLSRMPPGQYKRWRPVAPPPGRPGPVFRGPGVPPGPVFRGGEERHERHEREERYERRREDREDHDRDHDRGRGHGRGHEKHDD